MIVRAIIKHVTKWLNSFPVNNGVSKTVSPRKIMKGKDVHFNRDCKLEVGIYVQANEYPDSSNVTDYCISVGAIALGPSENEYGGYYFMILETIKKDS